MKYGNRKKEKEEQKSLFQDLKTLLQREILLT